MIRILFILILLAPLTSLAQLQDDFSDGDFTNNPTWQGDADRWIVTAGELQLSGFAETDTVILATPSGAAEGTWTFNFRDVGANLSNSNGIRVYLMASNADLRGDVEGYYLQFGTNNNDRVELYRQSGNISTRTKIGQGADDGFDGSDFDSAIRVTRDDAGNWEIFVNEISAFTALDNTFTASSWFGLWIKHSSANNNAWFFDNFDSVAPADETSPTITDASYDPSDIILSVSEQLNPATVTTAAFSLSDGLGAPDNVSFDGGALTITLSYASNPLPAGLFTLTINNLADLAGNVIAANTTVDIIYSIPAAPGDVIVNEIFYDPPSSDLEFVEVLNISNHPVDLANFTLSDNRLEPVNISDSSVPVPAGGYMVLVKDAAAFALEYPDVNHVQVGSWPALNNTGDDVIIATAGAGTIDSVRYFTSWGGNDVSLERLDPNSPSNAAINWGSSTDAAFATPGAQNSIYQPDVTAPKLIELTAVTETKIQLTFNEPIDQTSAANILNYSLSAGIGNATSATLNIDQVTLDFASPMQVNSFYTVSISNIDDTQGNTLVAKDSTFFFGAGAVPDAQDLIVNEIFYDPASGQVEYVEVFNRSTKILDLENFLLADNSRDRDPVTALTTIIQPDSFAIITGDLAIFRQNFPNVTIVVEMSSFPSLNNSGDEVNLYYDDTLIERVTYDDAWGGDGVALERKDPNGPANHAINWGDATSPTPGKQNSIYNPDTVPPAVLFAEETAASTVTISFTEPVDSALVSVANFTLNGNNASAIVSLSFDWSAVVVEFSGTSLAGGTLQVSGLADLTGNALAQTTVDVAILPIANDLIINEIMFDPLADKNDGIPDQMEYVEFFNVSGNVLTLTQAFWTDLPDEDGEADTLRIDQDLRVIVPAGGYLILYAESDFEENSTFNLEEAFPSLDINDPLLVTVAIDRTTLSLTNSEDVFAWHRRDGLLLDSLTYFEDWHLADLDDATGFSLERISPDNATTDAGNWTTSRSDEGGTPGRANSVFVETPVAPSSPGLAIAPSPFSPDGDGVDDIAGLTYNLSSDASLVRIRIFDSMGRLVRTLEDAALAGRQGTIFWDGFGDDGNRLRIGIYIVLFEAVDAQGGTVDTFKEVMVLARPLG